MKFLSNLIPTLFKHSLSLLFFSLMMTNTNLFIRTFKERKFFNNLSEQKVPFRR